MLPDNFVTARLVLRPIAIEDADAIFDTYAQDKQVARYLIWRPHNNLDATRTFIARCIATPHEVERTYVLVGRDDNVVRGAFAFASEPHTVLTAVTCWPTAGGGKA